MRKAISILLVFVMCLSLLPANAIAKDSSRTEQPLSTELNKGSEIPGTAYHVISKKNYSIAPDISESVIITNNDAGNSQTVANVMQVNPNEGRAKIVAGYGNRNPKELGWTLKTTTEQAHVYERETGLNVVGGVNASWFNINTGEPSGYLVMNGVVHHDNSSRAFLAAFDDGSVNVFREGTTLAQAEASHGGDDENRAGDHALAAACGRVAHGQVALALALGEVGGGAALVELDGRHAAERDHHAGLFLGGVADGAGGHGAVCLEQDDRAVGLDADAGARVIAAVAGLGGNDLAIPDHGDERVDRLDDLNGLALLFTLAGR